MLRPPLYAALILALCIAILRPTSAWSQTSIPSQNSSGGAAPAAAPTEKAPAAPVRTKLHVPLDQALLLVRSTLLTLNDANHSGNYTVLRDLASREFQIRNTSADLALVFAEMRRSNLSLFSVMLLSPQLSNAPEIDADGHLRVSGHVPTSPQQVKFDLVFEASSRQWKLLSLNISTTPVQASSVAQEQQKSEPKKQMQSPKAPPKALPAKGPPARLEAAQNPTPQPQEASTRQ
ncbi:hypothetical protein [Bradyrhizobium sp. WSM1743]|uniref:hypothetical protein n=1 Tax=Bradyrhizobium sp. WSM1743 TaxID=318996 RepID=UPI0018DBF52B|nr:hypothetical protein [Bradyrhizobium sp. WSM1743]